MPNVLLSLGLLRIGKFDPSAPNPMGLCPFGKITSAVFYLPKHRVIIADAFCVSFTVHVVGCGYVIPRSDAHI